MQPHSDVFFDKPQYTNVQMPFEHTPPYVPEENPTGIYERDFEIPSSWQNKRIVLHLGGYESVAFIRVNGEEVGLTKDSRLAAEFDITAFIKRGKNTLRIDVTKWSDATYIEDQDQWWHGGITRSVKLYATEHVFIGSVHTTAGLKKDNKTGTLKVEAVVDSINGKSITGYTLNARIEELPKSKSASMSATVHSKDAPIWTEVPEDLRRAGTDFFTGKYWRGDLPAATKAAFRKMEPLVPGPMTLETEIAGVAPWSAEKPVLYTLHLELLDPQGTVVQISSQRIGFRRTEVIGRDFLVNGQPVILYGVNRHDFNRHTGRALTREDMRGDLLELKRWNFNAVRTSHYPNDAAFLDLCDELGFYVIGEANIESHAFYDSICNDPRYLGAFVERVGRMIERDMHHPAVIFWSLGNESGAGKNHEAAAAYARALDPSRPLHYEGAIRNGWTIGHSLTDVICPMYPAIASIIDYAKSGKQDRPLIMCEYSHAMGNSNGTLAEYWDAIENLRGLQGGFIWEFWDHGPDQLMPDGTTRSAYGGDYGEKKHDGNFCCDGVVFPDRTAKPVLHEFKAIAAPVKVTTTKASSGQFTVFNKHFFSDLSDYELVWSIARDGLVVAGGRVALPKVAPRKTGKVTVKSPALLKADGKGERFITFSLIRKSSTAWAPASTEVGWAQFALPSRAHTIPVAKTSDLFERAVNDSGEIELPYGVIAPELSLWRAPTDNDRIAHIATKWDRWGLRELTRTDCTIAESARQTKIVSTWETSAGISVKQTQVVTPVAHGFSVKETIVLPKQLDDVARVGINFEIDGSRDVYSWFGTGSHESYPDRKIGRVHRYVSSVADQYVPYVRPQENGGHNGVRWFELTGGDGAGLRIDLGKPLQVSATPNRATELADKTHNVEVVPSGNVVVHIDAAHRGLGTASCGPDTLDKYRIKPGIYSFTWTVTSLSK
jgi:beta-galactosidase